MKKLFLVLGLFTTILAAQSCIRTHGPDRTALFETIRSMGVHTEVVLYDSPFMVDTLRSNLLIADSTGIYIQTPIRVTRIPFARIKWANFEHLPQLRIGSGIAPGRTKLNQLRLMSRFPDGTGGAGFTVYLNHLDQQDIDSLP